MAPGRLGDEAGMAPLRRERLAAGFARLVVGLRFLLLPAWIAAAVAATLVLPGLGSGEPLPLGGLVPRDSDALATGERAARLFSVPLTTDTVVVQRDPDGLSAEAQARVVERAIAATRHKAAGSEEIQLALPLRPGRPGRRLRATGLRTRRRA